MTSVIIRASEPKDISAVYSIYAHEVLFGLATFEVEPPNEEVIAARRAEVLGQGLPFLVAETDGVVVGYAYANRHRPRAAYRNSIEDSVYVAPRFHGRRIGSKLLTALIDACERGPWRQMIAVIGNSGNSGSIKLHSRLGFRKVGTLQAVGFKHGTWVDTVIMQRALGTDPTTMPDQTARAG